MLTVVEVKRLKRADVLYLWRFVRAADTPRFGLLSLVKVFRGPSSIASRPALLLHLRGNLKP